MGFREVVAKIQNANEFGYPQGASNRYKRLDQWLRLLEGTIYDHLATPFSEDFPGNDYVKLRDRRPDVIYNVAKVIADQHSSLTFGEAHFPHVRAVRKRDSEPSDAQKRTEDACAALVRELRIQAVMQEAVHKGSIGSAAMVAKMDDDGQAYIDVYYGRDCLPVLNRRNSRKVEAIEHIWAIDGETLASYGYTIGADAKETRENLSRTFWLRVTITADQWVWYNPLLDDDYARLGEEVDGRTIQWVHDPDRTGAHGFTALPGVWLRNLVVASDVIDGPCTFDDIADGAVAIDYELSQIDRGLRYAMDPLLVIQTGEMGASSMELAKSAGSRGEGFVKSVSNALPLMGEKADAKLLETNGKGYEAGREFVGLLREYLLETAGAMVRDTEKSGSGAPQSGKALELLYQVVVWYVERLRVCYGDNGLIPLLRILLTALKDGSLDLHDGEDWSGVDPQIPLSLQWPKWWVPRGADLHQEIQGMALAAGSSEKAPIPLVSPDYASRLLAQTLDADDVNAVADDAEGARDEAEKKQQQMADQDHQNQVELAKAKGPPKTAGGL